MIVVDANVLIYAYDRGSPHNEASAGWLERTLNGDEDVRIALVSLLGFVRIITHPTAFERPMSPRRAIEIVKTWLARPSVAIAGPTDRHWDVLAELAEAGQARGPLVMDAHLAALAREHGATLATTDRGFARYPRLRTIDPLKG